MKFKSIAMKNFRCFKDQKVEFSTKLNKNVSLFIGENTSGKTTLSLAIQWCLFGDDIVKSDDLANNDALQKISVNDSIEVSVSVEIECRHSRYTFTRVLPFKRCENSKNGLESKPIYNETSFECTIYDKHGIHVSRGGIGENKIKEVEHIVTQISPKKIRNFLFFDGERLQSLADDFNTQKSSETIRTAISAFLGLDTVKEAAQRLNQPIRQGVTNVKRILDKDLSKYTDESKKDHPDKIKDEEDKIASATAEIENCALLKQEYTRQINEKRKQIDENKEAANLQLRRSQEEELKHNFESTRSSLIREVKNKFSTIIGPLFIREKIAEAVRTIKATGDIQNDVPFIRAETIDWLLQRGICICGEKIEQGSQTEEFLKQLKKSLPPNSIRGALQEFLQSVEIVYDIDNLPENNLKFIENQIEKIHQLTEDITNCDRKIEHINKQLGTKGNFEDWINALQLQVTDLESEISKLDIRTGELQNQIIEATNNKNRLESELQAVNQNVTEVEFLKKCISYTDAAAETLNDFYNKHEKTLLKKLNYKVQQSFSLLTSVANEPSIGNDYVFRCRFPDQGANSPLSGAISTMAVFAVITSIIQLGKDILQDDQQFTASIVDTVPLVMDAPMSPFDKTRIKKFGENIPKLADQIIIFTKENDFENVLESIRPYIGKQYKIVRDSESASHIEA